MDNWFVLHQLSPALVHHRVLQRWLGPTRTRHLAVWLERNIAGLAGNVSLGLLLGIVPSVAIFFGLPLDVRHVTLLHRPGDGGLCNAGRRIFMAALNAMDRGWYTRDRPAEYSRQFCAGALGGDSRAERARAGTEIILSRVIETIVEITVKFRVAGWCGAITSFNVALK